MDRVGKVVCLDIGNHNIHYGVFFSGSLADTGLGFPKEDVVLGTDAIVYSSVNEEKLMYFLNFLKEIGFNGKILRLSATNQNLLKINYENISQLGDDRVAFAYYLWKYHGNGLGIDAGTFINVEFVKDGVHYPLAIFPGLSTILNCYQRGEKLKGYYSELRDKFKSLLLSWNERINSDFPKSSQDCIVLGVLLSLKGLIIQIMEKIGDSKVVFTGGDGELLENIVKKGGYDAHAVIKGLYAYYLAVLDSESKS